MLPAKVPQVATHKVSSDMKSTSSLNMYSSPCYKEEIMVLGLPMGRTVNLYAKHGAMILTFSLEAWQASAARPCFLRMQGQ